MKIAIVSNPHSFNVFTNRIHSVFKDKIDVITKSRIIFNEMELTMVKDECDCLGVRFEFFVSTSDLLPQNHQARRYLSRWGVEQLSDIDLISKIEELYRR
jgi:hypothetical protein